MTRSWGKYVVAPTNDGTIHTGGQKSINIAATTDREMYTRQSESSLDIAPSLPRNLRPPNPLGTYDMAENGQEWIEDRYDPEYYRHSPVKGLQGPEQSVFRDVDGYYAWVLRNRDSSGPGYGLTMVYYKADPESGPYWLDDKTVHCAVNHPSPVK